ncbi:staphylopine-dependent metal ABC transporter substrate-binding lipoprotein [Paenibacillus methanolicus]|uniref:Nickel transport system substrate-binding protein n=1 Tax=Paenibacillus methanolicus TaxID=582686 RepID=A0A5S5CAS6_9BACL|nr:nickel ABC transporter substrate-binding protein [Paenibacillus methanolicus]TYP76417.1 nickel transport system substrate-binding protein [Paenibacillus methanolicus]
MRKSWFTLIAGCMVLAVMLGGCSGTQAGSKEATNEAAHETPQESPQELVYAAAKDLIDMNPHVYAGSNSAQGMVYESLVEHTEEGIKPLLAESWEISGDGKSYTFHLRKDVNFHDGEPFNAEAVKLNIDAVQRNAKKHAWIKLSTKLTDVLVIDTHTVELVLSEPYYPTLNELSFTRPYVFVSPRNFIDGETKDGLNGYSGTGPYKLVEHKVDQQAVFEANEAYWGGSPAIKKITGKVLPAGETTFLALQKGEVNFVFTDDRGTDSIDVDAMTNLTDAGDYQIVRSKPMNTKMIVANSSQTNSPVHERAVRQAIWQAIDRETISKQIFSGTEPAAYTLFSSNVKYADVDLPQRGYDPEAARKLLEEAGWKLANGQEVRTKNGSKLTMKLYYDANSSSQKTQAEFIQHELKEIGMRLELVGEESTSVAKRRSAGDYELLFNQTWGLAYDPQSTIAAFTSESSYLHTTKGIARADELYDKIADVTVSMDETTRKSLYADILNIVHEEAVFIPLTNGGVTIVAPQSLQGIGFKQTQYELPFEKMNFNP